MVKKMAGWWFVAYPSEKYARQPMASKLINPE